MGYPSLFQYCVRELGLSEDESCLRILAARRCREHPQILEMLGKGELHLSGLARLSAHLSAADGARLLAEARGKSKREIERLVASRGEAAPKADAVRFLAPRTPAPNREPDMERAQLALSAMGAPADTPAPESPTQAVNRPPLARISFTASEELLLKIERARALPWRRDKCSGKVPGAGGPSASSALEVPGM